MAVAFETHDHGRCVETLVAAAESAAAQRKLRLTPIRRRVLELLLEEHRALGAYDVLARLQADGLGTHPPVAYRALDFLVEHGFAHKLERLNAFVACDCPQYPHRPAFLICRDCSAVAESDAGAVSRALAATASRAGFRIDDAAIEAEGLCPSCQSDAA
jgi:Fur family zinc uptake transcriptional regulator